MSDDFLSRWSRRKRDSAGANETPPAEPEIAGETPKPHDAAGEPAEPVFDLNRLPPLESITAETDIRAFLAPGVPVDMAREALRRAWTADPNIRNFVGLADYDWDFHTPGAIPGFGPLAMTDDLRQAVARIVGSASSAQGRDPAARGDVEQRSSPLPSQDVTSLPPGTGDRPMSSVVAPSGPDLSPDCDKPQKVLDNRVAAQNGAEKPEKLQTIGRRGHGGALPK